MTGMVMLEAPPPLPRFVGARGATMDVTVILTRLELARAYTQQG